MESVIQLFNVCKSLWGVKISVPRLEVSLGSIAVGYGFYYVWIHKGSAILAFLAGGMSGLWRFIW